MISIANATSRNKYGFGSGNINEMLRGVVYGSPIPQFVIDKDHKVVYWNKALEKYSGIKDENIIGTSLQWRAFYGHERPCLADLLVDREIKKIPKFYPGKYKKSKLVDGAYEATDFFPEMGKKGKWLYFTAALIRNSEEDIIGAVETLEDVTESKELERVREEFISLASHQLRDAPTAINWSAQTLLDGDLGPLNEKQKKFVSEIYQRNKNSIGLINDLLDVSRMDLGTFLIDREPTDIRNICQNVIKEFEIKIAEKKLQFGVHYDNDIPIIQADPQLIQIILQNLISNAIRYTSDGGKIDVKISVSAVSRRKKDSDNILIAVADTGCGIPESQKSKIFTRMFRADNAKSIQAGGTGLGLYIIKSILGQANGKIWFESQENKGSTFYVSIPLAGMKAKKGDAKLSLKVT
jgi:signal transduction histidine kinase